MTGIEAQVQLAVHLDNVVKIITRTLLASLDLNPFLPSMIDNISEKSFNLLGTLIDNGQFIHQIINKVGKIINQVLGPENEILSATIVGDYRQNMTFTGVSKTLENGYIINQYSYLSPSISSKSKNILINIVFDTRGNILNTNVLNPTVTNTACNSRQNVGK